MFRSLMLAAVTAMLFFTTTSVRADNTPGPGGSAGYPMPHDGPGGSGYPHGPGGAF